MNKRITLSLLTMMFSASVILSSACAQKTPDLVFQLSDRHKVPEASVLEKQYPSQEEFIDKLLELRLTDKPPFVALRAENMLLEYSDNPKVISHLEEDLVTEGRMGLARVIIRGLPRIKDEAAKARMSKMAADLVENNSSLKYLREDMKKVEDPVVKKAFGF